jgi:hypothetical protein
MTSPETGPCSPGAVLINPVSICVYEPAKVVVEHLLGRAAIGKQRTLRLAVDEERDGLWAFIGDGVLSCGIH